MIKGRRLRISMGVRREGEKGSNWA